MLRSQVLPSTENVGGAIRTHVVDAERWILEAPLTAAWTHALSLRCHPADFHYLEVNLRAHSRANAIHLTVKDLGLEPMVAEIVDQVRKLGPNPYRTQ
jgi:coenzyme F420-reducing hydrogenase delta subunit